ncbi:MAG: F0F1 ATP synthase subunit B [Saprospiraceae bacterium]|nr:F0F1 ATP synthase subunit B [Lewinellaceae bacterium]
MISLLFALEFSVIKPDYGLLFWTAIIFLTVWFVLGRSAFPAIAEALKKRAAHIEDALASAEKAREEMQNLHAENEKLLTEAREERSKILREAKEARDAIVKEAKDKAKEEAQRVMTSATLEIEKQKNAAIQELKSQAGLMALDIAEKVIRKELKGQPEQEAFVQGLVDDIKLN